MKGPGIKTPFGESWAVSWYCAFAQTRNQRIWMPWECTVCKCAAYKSMRRATWDGGETPSLAVVTFLDGGETPSQLKDFFTDYARTLFLNFHHLCHVRYSLSISVLADPEVVRVHLDGVHFLRMLGFLEVNEINDKMDK